MLGIQTKNVRIQKPMRKPSIGPLLAVAALTAALALGGWLTESAAAHPETEYNDGVYVAVSDATNRGYLMAVVVIQEGRIAQVRLTEMDGFGRPKPDAYPWPEFHEAMEVLPQRFVDANSADVDTVTGATSTSRMARQAVQRALLKASDPGDGRYFDGTFFGRSAADDHGFGVALVTIKDDAIVAVELHDALPDFTWKDWETYPHETTVAAREWMQQQFVAAGTADVDAVSGATGSSTKWIAAVENALRSAEK